jgi:hypothetical protein
MRACYFCGTEYDRSVVCLSGVPADKSAGDTPSMEKHPVENSRGYVPSLKKTCRGPQHATSVHQLACRRVPMRAARAQPIQDKYEYDS